MTVDVYETGVGFEEHFGIVEFFLFCGFINVRTFLSEELIFMYIGAEVLNKLRLDFFVFDIQSVTDVVKLPPPLDLEVLGQFFPVVVDAFNQLEIGLDN